ncbi:MAG: hypothetical protein HC915_10555 [Anaerolineae bacterium]|nr:hypothetical protein [Anaerolineae bacterium]
MHDLRALIAEFEASDLEIRHSTPEAYLERVTTLNYPAPEYHGDIQRVLAGTYTSIAPIKRQQRQAEAWLASAERWAALAWWRYGLPYPAEELRAAWQRVMLNAFHDVLPGSLIENALPGVMDMYGYAKDTARRIVVSRQHAALPNVAPTPETIPLYVLNPHAHHVRGYVGGNFLRAYAGSISPGDFALYDDLGPAGLPSGAGWLARAGRQQNAALPGLCGGGPPHECAPL